MVTIVRNLGKFVSHFFNSSYADISSSSSLEDEGGRFSAKMVFSTSSIKVEVNYLVKKDCFQVLAISNLAKGLLKMSNESTFYNILLSSPSGCRIKRCELDIIFRRGNI